MSRTRVFQTSPRRVVDAVALALAPIHLSAQSWPAVETKKKYPATLIDLLQRMGWDSDLRSCGRTPPDKYRQLHASCKASYAFRDKIDTDGVGHARNIDELSATLLRRGYNLSNI